MSTRMLSLRGLVGVVAAAMLMTMWPGVAVAGEAAEPPGARRWRADPLVSERAGSAGAGWFVAWTANTREQPGRYNAYLRESDSGIRWRLNKRGTQADFGNFLGNQLTFRQRRPGRPGDLYRGSAYGPFRIPFPSQVNTSADELDPTLGGKWLLFTRYRARDHEHRVMLFNRRTQRLRTLATASGGLAVRAGQVRGDYATWYTWGADKSDVYRHRISTGRTVRLPRPARFTRQYGSSVGADGTVYFHRRRSTPCRRGATELVMRPLEGRTKVLHTYPARRTGQRTVLNPPALNRNLIFTVRRCRAPQARATDLYFTQVPANPMP
jgi:hypothetical protein